MDEEALTRAITRSQSKTMVYKFWSLIILILALVIGWIGSIAFNGLAGGLITGLVVFGALGYPLHRWYVR